MSTEHPIRRLLWTGVHGLPAALFGVPACWLITIVCVQSVLGQSSPPTSGKQREAVDKIWYGPAPTRERDSWNLREGFYFEGTIQEFDSSRLTYLDAKGQKRELESQRVERVYVVWSSELASAVHAAYSSHRYAEIPGKIQAALASGIPQWQQRLLIGELIESADAMGKTLAACKFFLNLVEANPPPLLYATIPLCWTACEPDRALQTEAEKWLSSSSDHQAILGASWLLNGPRSDEAKQRLSKLKTGSNQVLAQLATVQLWRAIPPPETKSHLNSWFDFRDRMLVPLQIGPTEFLADRIERVSMAELAVGEWTRIATVHRDRYHRASRALEAARDIFSRENRPLEAERYAAWIEQLHALQSSGQP